MPHIQHFRHIRIAALKASRDRAFKQRDEALDVAVRAEASAARARNQAIASADRIAALETALAEAHAMEAENALLRAVYDAVTEDAIRWVREDGGENKLAIAIANVGAAQQGEGGSDGPR